MAESGGNSEETAAERVQTTCLECGLPLDPKIRRDMPYCFSCGAHVSCPCADDTDDQDS